MTTSVASKKPMCPAEVKGFYGKKNVCGLLLKDGRCSNRALHVGTMKTGDCNSGWCEGTVPTDWRGRPVPSCKMWRTCPCDCHLVYDQMFQMSELERIPVDNSTYKPEPSPYVMPTLEERIASSRERDIARGAKFVPSELPDVVPATVAKPFTPTPSGRTQKGELESWVKAICDAYLVDQLERPCTVGWVSEEIARREGIKAPSLGAIDAVWKRWTTLGFAVVEKKPTRFVKYTDDGIKYTLQGMKDRARIGGKR